MLDIDTLINRLGGSDAAARLTGVGTEAGRKGRQAGSVPTRHWPAVIAATGLSPCTSVYGAEVETYAPMA